MFDSRVLETAIGLIFLFLGVSLATTAIQELIASITRLRAFTLRAGLKTMLVQGKQGLAFYEALMRHPVVAPGGKSPSYISAEQFSTTVLHLLGNGEAIPLAISSIRIAATNMPDSPIKSVAQSMFREGEQDLNIFERRLQHWFDQSMDRLSGDYKRISQYLSFVTGLALAFLFQINAIGIAYGLWKTATLRSAALDAAAKAAGSTGSLNADKIINSLSDYQLVPIWQVHPTEHILVWVLGCTITAVAVTLGAPFWFDLLQSFITLRGTGPEPISTMARIGTYSISEQDLS